MEPPVEKPIAILIVETLPIVRAGLRALVNDQAGFEVRGETGEGRHLPDLVARLQPDVLILEAGMAGSAPAMQEAKNARPDLKVVVLAAPEHAANALALLAAGANGCFLKSDQPGEFLRGIRAAFAGELAISSSVARLLLGSRVGHGDDAPAEPLTAREREVLDLLCDGLTNKEIAQRLYLSVRTVEVHLRNAYAKLGVRSRLEAVTRAQRKHQ